MDVALQGQGSGTLLTVCCMSFLQDFSPPLNNLFYPSASYGWAQACQCKLVITTLRRPDPPIVIEAGLPHEKPVLDLLNERNLEYPDG